VLVVADNRDTAETLAEVVEMFGHDAEIAFDGPSAVERVRAHKPDVVLCDIGMPGMSGLEVVRRLREQPECRDLRIAALTGFGQEEDRRRTREAGFDAHLAKPVDIASLQRLL
jgi:CheY-like chemotaxis protein